MFFLQILAGVLTAGGAAYLIIAFWQVGRSGGAPPSDALATVPAGRTFTGAGFTPPVSLLVPVHGDRPRLEECLTSVCRQAYPGYQVIFGLHSAADPAWPVVERVLAAHRHLDLAAIIDSRRIGLNPKNSNLANMVGHARHDILVMVDSDILLQPDFLAGIVRPLADPRTGGVTCLYSGTPYGPPGGPPGLVPRLEALFINDWFIPPSLVDCARGDLDFCYGAAIAVTRRALERIGGFSSMADAVAQDYVIGHRLHQAGYRVCLGSPMVETVTSGRSLRDLFLQELRWSRALRAVRPLEHALSVFMSPLVPAAVLLFASCPWRLAAGLVLCHLALRAALHAILRLRFRLPPAEPWLLPLREALNFAVWAAALSGRRVRWGDRILITGPGLSMRPLPHHQHTGADMADRQGWPG